MLSESESANAPYQECPVEFPAELTQVAPPVTAASTLLTGALLYIEVPSPGPSNVQPSDILITSSLCSTIQLTLTFDPQGHADLTHGSHVRQGVTVSYAKRTSQQLQNVICEDTPGFSAMSVTNLTQ